MVGLKAKICSLLNFNAYSNLMLRYIDEDGDLVTLVDDDDLNDMMMQRLLFLRISVDMSNDSGGKSSAISNGNVAIADVLKSVQEPLNIALSSLCLVSKALSSASPVSANLDDTISKVRKPIPNSHLQPDVAAVPSSKNGAPEEHAISETKGPKSTYVNQPHITSSPSSKNCVPNDPARVPQPVNGYSLSARRSRAVAKFVSRMRKHVQNSPYQWLDVWGGVPEEHVRPGERGPQSTYVDPASYGSQPMEAGNLIRGAMERVTPFDLNVSLSDPYSSQSANVNIIPLSSAVSGVNGKKDKAPTNDSFDHKGKICGSHNDKISGTSSTSAAPNNCPTRTSSSSCTKTPIYTGDTALPPLGNFRAQPFKKSDGRVMALRSMIHKGICCDGCGACPIMGPRFKSKVKENYDLCSICFKAMGNVTDYSRIDRHHPGCNPTLPHTLNVARPKLDSRFIMDVTVIDGSMMAPSTAFTKIWRIGNNGTLVWPKGTQLVWIGGDNFSDSHSVDLEVPEEGVPVDKELDIEVKFIAPMLPGIYISYWGMASPSGQKFGQHVWVRIQVVASLKVSFYDSHHVWNLDILRDVSSLKGARIIDFNVQPTENDAFQPHVPNAPTVPVSKMIENQQMQELVNNYIKTISAAAFSPVPSAPATSFAMVDNQFRQKMDNYSNDVAVTATSAAAAAPATYAAAAAPATYAAAAATPATYAAVASAPATYAAAAPATSMETVDNQLMLDVINEIMLIKKSKAATSSVASDPSASAAASLPATSIAPSSVSYPVIYLSETTPDVPSNQQSAAVGAPSSSLLVDGNNSIEEPLLKELEEMGFKQIDLNSDIPRLNEYNMERSLDNLCGVSEWDPILKELHEMGFLNTEMNKKLHMKNNGNINLIVMDLLNGEQA
ncbi:hypothetical protein Lal_00049986 [Lupinus albus]|nr:hypothetical protein Lal_00049986 [Lupinus albus]